MWSRTPTHTAVHHQQLQPAQLQTQFDASSGGTGTNTSLPRVTAGTCAGSCRDPLAGLSLGFLHPQGTPLLMCGTPQPFSLSQPLPLGAKSPSATSIPPGPHQVVVPDPTPLGWKHSGINLSNSLKRQQFLQL